MGALPRFGLLHESEPRARVPREMSNIYCHPGKAGGSLAYARIEAESPLGKVAVLDVVIQNPKGPTDFVPGVQHNHMPCGRWDIIQADPNNLPTALGVFLSTVCTASATPKIFVDRAMFELSDQPLALQHMHWYLSNGHGADFIERLLQNRTRFALKNTVRSRTNSDLDREKSSFARGS